MFIHCQKIKKYDFRSLRSVRCVQLIRLKISSKIKFLKTSNYPVKIKITTETDCYYS